VIYQIGLLRYDTIQHQKSGGRFYMGKYNKQKFLITFSIVLAIILSVFLFMQVSHKKEKPKIDIANNIVWDPNSSLDIKISADKGLKSVKIILTDGSNKIKIKDIKYKETRKHRTVNINFPKNSFTSLLKHYKIIISATDNSKDNNLSKKTTKKIVNIKLNRKNLKVFLVNHNFSIRKGGVAIVIFRAKIKNLKDLYIEINSKKRFYPTPFYKPGYFISLIAWSVKEPTFNAKIVAKYNNNGISQTPIYIFKVDKKYRVSRIKLGNILLDEKISELVAKFNPKLNNISRVKKFQYINETLRKKSEDLIKNYTTPTDKEMVSDFYQKSFYPLRGGALIASFGNNRYFFYSRKLISESWHLGLDLASPKDAKIKTQNKGRVIFANQNGIYGNTLILYHGLGVYTLYGHCSTLLTKKGDNVKSGQMIAHIGSTGLALGDNLYFSVLVQGVAVMPAQWMDSKWIKLHIGDIIKTSKKLIDKN